MAERLGYRPELDGLRALAVGVVMGLHLHFRGWLPGGYIGVDVFFVLSGFLITTLMWDARAAGAFRFGGFYVRRAARLFPALALVVVVVVPLYLLLQPEGAVETRNTIWGAFAAVTYSSAWWRAFTTNELGRMGHTWSLGVEEYFYVFWPVVFGWLWSVSASRTVRRVAVVVAVAVGCQAIGVAAGVDARHLYNGPDFRCSQILIGCLLAVLLATGRLGRSKADGTLFIVAVVFLAGFVAAGPDATTTASAVLVTPIAVAAAVVIRHLFMWPTGRASSVLALRPFVWVGVRSYGLYLWHYPVYGLIVYLGLSRSKLVVGQLVASVVVAAMSFALVERPARLWVRGRWADGESDRVMTERLGVADVVE